MLLLVSVTQSQVKDFPTLDHIRTSVSDRQQTDAVAQLIQRLIGSRSTEFDVVINSTIGPQYRDTFKLATAGGVVSITGSTGVAAAWGFYYYLSQYCGCHVSWAGDQVTLPEQLPALPSQGFTVTSQDRYRYYQNVCTVSYSSVWWNWTRWEREIDWMAMNGINLPLAFSAQEAIWQRVLLKMGFTQVELDNHFGGTAFLAWSRMGNMHGWGGPLPQSWHDMQITLQHKILQRMRDLGMIPVLPAFAGHVPDAITRVFPSANVSHLGDWGNFNSTFCCTLLLDLNDPLFATFGKAFITEYISEFGTDHIYNTDTFNEMVPKSSDPSYLQSAGKAVYNAMLAGDPQAIWLMRGWLFLNTDFWKPDQAKALLTSVPIGKMIVLDLFSEVSPQYIRLSSYFGQPFIWCMLHNFGGTVGMYGVIDNVNQEPHNTRLMKGSTMIGVGITPEGINQNNMIYEFMMENGWRDSSRNISNWIQNYAVRRYGLNDDNANYAWQSLVKGVYNCTTGSNDHGSEVIVLRLGMQISVETWYSATEFVDAWDHFIMASDSLSTSQLYRYDLIDISRQSLQLISNLFYADLVSSYQKKAIDSFKVASRSLLTLLLDMDVLLSTDKHFLLGHWLEDAKALGINDMEKALYEYNARNQLTLWGPTGNIVDYACKQWAGLMSGYYYPRWKLFVEELLEHWNSTFDETQFEKDVFSQVEQPFTFAKNTYPVVTSGMLVSSKANSCKTR